MKKMKKFKKIVLSSLLALSTLAVVSVSETDQASAANDYWMEICKNDSLCLGVFSSPLRLGTYDNWASTKVEIKSGYGVVSVTSDGNRVKAMKPGEAVVYSYDRTGVDTGKYSIYKVLVK